MQFPGSLPIKAESEWVGSRNPAMHIGAPLASILQPTHAILCAFFPLLHVLCESLRHDQRERDGGVRAHLNRLGVDPNLTPADRLVGTRPAVAPVELVPRVDVHGKVSPVPHQVGVARVVLRQPSPDDDLAGRVAPHGQVVDPPNVPRDVEDEAGTLVRVEVDHVPDAPVREGRAEYRDVVLISPVENALVVVDLLPEAGDEFGGGDRERSFRWRVLVVISRSALCGGYQFPRLIGPPGVLLIVHPRYQRGHPVLELAVILVRHQQVPDAVDALLPQRLPRQFKISHIRVLETFDNVLLYSPRRRHYHIHHFILGQKFDDLALPARDLVGGVRQEDSRADVLSNFGILQRVVVPLLPRNVGEPPFSHATYFLHGPAEVGRLEAHVEHGRHDGIDRVVFRILEVVSPADGVIVRHRLALP
mmetsp:Transcript_6593/g.14353  ORF Transcript_6593/g.14353 Transcript_6593/m.14353 type:complete len:419 (-) Transcript_6593:4-1260(-)